MRIAVVGPTYPYRGGIAHYTTLLVRALRAEHQVSFYSFRRQYPSFLFPGRSDHDNSTVPLRVECAYTLDLFNPLTWELTAARILTGNSELLILPWWHPIWAPAWLYLAARCRRQGIKLLFETHNVVTHETRTWDRWITRLILSFGDKVIVHSNDELAHLEGLLPQITASVVPHPSYASLTNGAAEPCSQQQARQQLGLVAGKPVALFFGFVRSYKGLDILVEAVAQIRDELELHLLVAGEFWIPEETITAAVERFGLTEQVTIINEYIPNESIGRYFAAADVVVLPYRTVSGSGVAQLAFGHGKPVIASRIGALAEAVLDGETGLLVPANNPAALAGALRRFFVELRHRDWSTSILAANELFSWERLVNEISEME